MSENKPRPCFHCLTEPAMEGHKVCDKHHCEPKCTTCHPELKQYVPDTVLNLPRDPHRRHQGSAW